MLIDDRSGRPFAVVEANYLNGMRTAAANALAVKHLASPEAATLGLIGIGHQAVFEAEAVAHVRPIRRILAAGKSTERCSEFQKAVRDRLHIEVEFTDIEQVARAADVLVTVTPAREPLVRAEWIRPGTHISAMGADGKGKQELAVDLVGRSELWVDHPEQAIEIGEAQHAHRAGLVTLEQLRERTLGALLKNPPKDAASRKLITDFDSSGIAVQDLAAAQVALRCVQAARDGVQPR